LDKTQYAAATETAENGVAAIEAINGRLQEALLTGGTIDAAVIDSLTASTAKLQRSAAMFKEVKAAAENDPAAVHDIIARYKAAEESAETELGNTAPEAEAPSSG
jgi:hypothetical protein